MICSICKDRNENSKTYGMEAEFYFSELFELLASLHVICNPSHHAHRQKWWNIIKNDLGKEMYEQILLFGPLTHEWMIPMDFCDQFPYIGMDFEDTLFELEKLALGEWNKLFCVYGKKCSENQKHGMLCLWKSYYDDYFQRELVFLKPLLVRELEKESKEWKINGFEASIKTLHSRLKLEEKEFIFYKNKEYHFSYETIEKIYFTATTFLDPHLILGERDKGLSLLRSFHAEEKSISPPKELFYLHYALSDQTRLCILRLLRRGPKTTKELSDKLQISAAGISKQLKVLKEANLVYKKRKGSGVYYFMKLEELDFLTYRIFEFLG